MIKIENIEVYGWDAAIRGMRNPMNSWDKSDSFLCDGIGCRFEDCPHFDGEGCWREKGFVLGINDFTLMEKLVSAGTDHSKFMRMINVTLDITAPLYWWKEFDTYKVGTVRNSCSTMHKIHAKPFTMEDFSCDHLEDMFLHGLRDVVDLLNNARNMYLLALKDEEPLVPAKDYWWQMIQLLPSSYNQRATVQMNYQVLRNMYHARKNHKLDEWKEFCEWIEGLPYSELITMKKEKNNE